MADLVEPEHEVARGVDPRYAGALVAVDDEGAILQLGAELLRRQGRGGRTHLVSPEMAAAAAIEGHFVDIRDWS